MAIDRLEENRMRRAVPLLSATALLALGACTVPPPAGPSVMALPGQGKDFATFQQDDAVCREFAWQQTGGASPSAAASQSAVGSAAVGTVLGAAAGAAIGAAAGNPGAGAAIGAGTGLLAGSAVGANNAAATYGSVQQYYDVSYTQCMVAHGNTVQPPPTGYAGYPYGGGYPYPPAYPYAGYDGPTVVAPSVAIGIGSGWGWGWGGWRGGWHGGWRGGGWHR